MANVDNESTANSGELTSNMTDVERSTTADEQWSDVDDVDTDIESSGKRVSDSEEPFTAVVAHPARTIMKKRRCFLIFLAISFAFIGILVISLRSAGVYTGIRLSRTTAPTAAPSKEPTDLPTRMPTQDPTSHPTSHPTSAPTGSPTSSPTSSPTTHPTASPTTAAPTALRSITVVGEEDKDGMKVKVPRGTMPGDLMVLFVGGGCKTEPKGISPGGWKLIDDKGSDDLSISAYYKPFDCNGTMLYEITKGEPECVMPAMVSLRGVDLESPVVDMDIDFETRGGKKGESRAPKVKTEVGGLVLAAFAYDDEHSAKIKTDGFETLASFATDKKNGFALGVSSKPTEDGEAGPIDAASGKTADGAGEEVAMTISFRRSPYSPIVLRQGFGCQALPAYIEEEMEGDEYEAVLEGNEYEVVEEGDEADETNEGDEEDEDNDEKEDEDDMKEEVKKGKEKNKEVVDDEENEDVDEEDENDEKEKDEDKDDDKDKFDFKDGFGCGGGKTVANCSCCMKKCEGEFKDYNDRKQCKTESCRKYYGRDTC